MQRAYLVTSVLWIVAVVAVSINERPTALITDRQSLVAPVQQAAGKTDTNVSDPGKQVAEQYNKESKTLSDPDVWLSAYQAHEEELKARRSMIAYWEMRAALTLTPPVVGYVFLFVVAPWILRGFRSTPVEEKPRGIK